MSETPSTMVPIAFISGVTPLRIDENIYFANATQIENKLIKRVQKRPGTQHLLVVCSSINMIDATRLAKMKPTGVIINVARGKIIDEDALFDERKTRAVHFV